MDERREKALHVTRYCGANKQVQPTKSAGKPSRFCRITQMFRGLRMAEKLLAEAGFITNSWAHDVFGALREKLMVEVKVTETPRTAHVTSYVGYTYDSEKINAKITHLQDLVGDTHIVRIIFSKVDGPSASPIYLTIRKDSDDPAKETFIGVMNTIRNFAAEHGLELGNAMRQIEPEVKYLDYKDVIDI